MKIPFKKVLLITIGVLALAGCASYFKKKECNKTNWYQYGFDIAMQGQRLDADNYVSQCQKVDANIDHAKLDVGFKAGMAKYCRPETVYGTGREGKPFAGEMCDSSRIRTLKKEHARGLRAYCQPNNGYKVGADGQTYGNLCPKKMEPAFLSQFSKGRRVYLQGQIDDKQNQIRQVQGDIRQLERAKQLSLVKLSAMPSSRVVTRNRSYNADGSVSSSTDVGVDQEVKSKRQRVQWDIDKKDREIKEAYGKITSLRNEIRDRKKEIRSLR